MIAQRVERLAEAPVDEGSVMALVQRDVTYLFPDPFGHPVILDPIVRHVRHQLSQLEQLPEGWDSYGALRVDPRVVDQAARWLVTALRCNYPAPFIVPTPIGGLAFEWHRNERELSMELFPTGEATAYFWDPATGDEREATGAAAGWVPQLLPMMEP